MGFPCFGAWRPSLMPDRPQMPSSLRRQKKKKSNPFNDSLCAAVHVSYHRRPSSLTLRRSDSDSSPNPPTVSSSSRVGPGVVGEKKQFVSLGRPSSAAFVLTLPLLRRSAAPAPASPRDLPATPSLAPSSNSNSNILSKLPSFHRNKLDSRSKAAPSPPQPAPTSEPQKSNEVAVSPAPISTPRKPSPSFSIPASAERAAGPSKERITTAAASKASATASDEGLASPQRLDEAAEAKLAQRRQQERASEVAEAAEREKTNQIKYTNLEGLLKETKIFVSYHSDSRPV